MFKIRSTLFLLKIEIKKILTNKLNIMRKFLLLIALLISGAGIISAQNEITIGNGTSSDYNAPFNNYYKQL